MINIKTTNKTDLPIKAHEGDACADIVAKNIRNEAKYIEYGTGLKMLPDEGYLGLVFPRSSISDYDLILCNSVGVIDEYTGEWKIRFKKTKKPILDSLYKEISFKRDICINTIREKNSLNVFKLIKKQVLQKEIEKLKKEIEYLEKQVHEIESSERIYKIGDKIAQFLFIPKTNWTYTTVETMPITGRQEGGFGSTTK